MKKKIIGIFVMTLLIAATVLPVVNAVNIQTTQDVEKNNYLETCPSTPTGSSGIINIKIVAKVTDVQDPYNLLGGAIKVGDKITGKYNYDSGTPDSEPDPKEGQYIYTSSTFGIELKAGGLVFKTNPSNVDFWIIIGNDIFYLSEYVDLYTIISYNNLQLSNGMYLDRIVWWLEDDTCTALSSDDLPTIAPILSDWAVNILYLLGSNPSDPYEDYLITATVTKATKSRARDVYFTSQPILNWLFEHFANMFPILKHLIYL